MPPENNTEIRIDNTLLTQTNDALAVGFKNEESLYFLKKILVELFDKEHKLEDKNKEEIQRGLRSVTDAVNNQTKKEESANEKLAKQLMKVTEEEKRKWKVAEAYLKTAADVSIRALNLYMKNTQELTSLFRNLDKNGILVKDGFDSLGNSAYNLGMTYEELANNLTKLSPIVAKLNGSMGNGVKIFEKSLMAIPKSLSLAHDEQVSAFQMATDGLTASHIKSINSEEELIKRVVDTAKEMKLLKIVTGKSIEAMKEENNARMKDARFKQFESRFGSGTMATLKSVFKNDNAIEWLLTGGTAHAGEMATLMANSPGLQRALPEIMQLVQSGNLTTESMIGVISKYQDQLTQKGALARNFAGQAGHMAAAGLSSNYQNIAFNTDIEDSMLSLVKNPQEIMNSEAYLKDQRLRNNSQGYRENLNRIGVKTKELTTGGVEGMANAYGIGSKPLGWAASGLNAIDGLLKGYNLSGTTSALLSSAIGTALPNVGSWLLGKAWGGIKTFFGGKTTEKSIADIDKNVDKLANGTPINPSNSIEQIYKSQGLKNWTKNLLGNVMKFLPKILPVVGTALGVAGVTASVVAIGMKLYNNYKDSLSGNLTPKTRLDKVASEYQDMSPINQQKIRQIVTNENLSWEEAVTKYTTTKDYRKEQIKHWKDTGDLAQLLFVPKEEMSEIENEKKSAQSLTSSDENNKMVLLMNDMNTNIKEMTSEIKNMSAIGEKSYRHDVLNANHPTTTVSQSSY